MGHKIYFVTVAILCFSGVIRSQENHAVPLAPGPHDTTVLAARQPIQPNKANNELDLIDVATSLIHGHFIKREDTGEVKSFKLRFSAVPAAGYTLQTGFAGLAVANVAFYTNKQDNANVSSVLASFTYSVKNQIILPVQTNIWTKNNKFNIVLDWRYLKFPSYTYGLGGYTTFSEGYLINYSALRFHQRALAEVSHHLYLGLGYDVDYFWNIKELNPPPYKVTDFESYGLSKSEFASGFTFNLLYDDRRNSINPEKGNFLNIIYRPNLAFLGNNATWRSLVIDARKYIKFPAGSENVFAFWNYDWLTLSGTPPYLMLPNTGGDPYSNTGRGYIQGRYRGKNMLYDEGEYRFRITHNGLLGAVVFANAQSVSEEKNNNFQVISPGYGAGLRIKLNKFSRTNIALDYGFGTHGSNGLFVNLGEVF